ncbi:MAG: hypothetical protein M9899_08100 [Bdellovibrionaceae bacterium]|nr:hypothetical protein [Pseudobdellovibrionaceae bacterium]
MILKTIVLLVLLTPLYSYAQYKANSLKDIELFPANLQKVNQVKFLTDPDTVKDVQYQKTYCLPLEPKNIGPRKKERIIYAPTQKLNKAVDYIKSLYVRGEGQQIEMQVNGYHIVANSKVPIYFELIDDCTKLRPIGFYSPIEQDFLGVKLKKGSIVNPVFLNENIEWGEFGAGDYGGPWKGESYEEKEKMLEDFEVAKKRQEAHMKTCIEIRDPLDLEKSVYLYKNKVLTPDIVSPGFWRAQSKYIGHRLCSDQPNAVIDCVGSMIQEFEFDQIFGKATIDDMESELSKKNYKVFMERAKELGKKCDDVIAQHEKKTGKKVKISPYYPEELLKKEKFK